MKKLKAVPNLDYMFEAMAKKMKESETELKVVQNLDFLFLDGLSISELLAMNPEIDYPFCTKEPVLDTVDDNPF